MSPNEPILTARQILINELIERKKQKPAYSMRAFARDTGASQPFLSAYFSGKRAMSGKMARKIGSKLNWSQAQIDQLERFCERERDTAQGDLQRTAPVSGAPLALLQYDQFAVLGSWQHFAALEALTVSRFKGAPQLIATAIGVSELDAHQILERLVRMKLATKKSGVFKRVPGALVAECPSSATLGQSFQRNVLMKAMEAQLIRKKRDRRSATTFVAVSMNQMNEVEKILDRASNEIRALSEAEIDPHGVIVVSMHAFKL